MILTITVCSRDYRKTDYYYYWCNLKTQHKVIRAALRGVCLHPDTKLLDRLYSVQVDIYTTRVSYTFHTKIHSVTLLLLLLLLFFCLGGGGGGNRRHFKLT